MDLASESTGLLPSLYLFKPFNPHQNRGSPLLTSDVGHRTLDLARSDGDDFAMFPEDPSQPRAHLADGRIRLDRRQKGGEEIDVASGRRLELG